MPGQCALLCTWAAPEKPAAWRSQNLTPPRDFVPGEGPAHLHMAEWATGTALTVPKPALLVAISILEWDTEGELNLCL